VINNPLQHRHVSCAQKSWASDSVRAAADMRKCCATAAVLEKGHGVLRYGGADVHALMSVFNSQTMRFHPRAAVVGADERTGEEAGPIDVGDQALMRGLVTAVPSMRLRRSLSKSGRRRCRPHNVEREFLYRCPAPTLVRRCDESLSGRNYAAWTSFPIAHTKPESSRARAVTVTVCFFPLPESALYRAHSRSWALTAMSRTAGGRRACR
jgi:hypothetical protein